MLTTSPSRVDGLSAFVGHYDALVCDVWGVVHNGITAFERACDALVRWRAGGGRVLLLTNAPRPAGPIHEQLARLGVPREATTGMVTALTAYLAALTLPIEESPEPPSFLIATARGAELFSKLRAVATVPASSSAV